MKSPNLPTRVGPGAKLEVALLVVEGKPCDVDLTGRLKQLIDVMFCFYICILMYYHYTICIIESGIHFKFGCSHLKYARRDIKTASLTVNNNICLVSPVELLVSAGFFSNYDSNLFCCQSNNRN